MFFTKNDHRFNWERWFFVFVVGVGFWLRVRGLFANGLHGDEALFGTWARWIANGQDFWLRGQVVDKPPLLFYVQGLFWQVLDSARPELVEVVGFQQPTFALRLPNLIASLLLLPLIYKIALTLFNDKLTAQLTLVLFALSPFLIQFSPTAFTDPLMLTLTAASTLVILRSPRRRISVTSDMRCVTATGILRFAGCFAPSVTQNDMALIAGVLFGMAVGVKLNALLLMPLVVAVVWWWGVDWRRFWMGFGLFLDL